MKREDTNVNGMETLVNDIFSARNEALSEGAENSVEEYSILQQYYEPEFMDFQKSLERHELGITAIKVYTGSFIVGFIVGKIIIKVLK